jgi:hypothetical protein
VGRNLYSRGYVQPAELQYAAAAVPYGYAPWRKNPQRPTLTRQTRKGPNVCASGYERNQITGRCIRVDGPTYRKLNPRILSESSGILPLGKAGVAPLADKSTILAWSNRNCKYKNDLLTGSVFANETPEKLQSLVRLHDGSCVTASALNEHVKDQHKTGKIATLPHAKDTHMTLDDFKALREIMRRTVPGYKIPARAHQPPPTEWQLYAASDQRSGPEFISILFVDVTKARSTASGIEYPLESIRSDLGFLPITSSLQTFLALLQRLASLNRLLTPVPGGWSPLHGFPYSKNYWSIDRTKRLKKLYDILLASISL